MPTKSFEYLNSEIIYVDTINKTPISSEVLAVEYDYQTNKRFGVQDNSNFSISNSAENESQQAKLKLLNYLGKKSTEYDVVFVPNLFYGINLLLDSLSWSNFKTIITGSRESNLTFIPALTAAQKFSKNLRVLSYNQDDSLDFSILKSIRESVTLFSTMSELGTYNLNQAETIIKLLKEGGNLVILEASKSLGHQKIDFKNLDFDILTGTGTLLYGSNLSFLVVKKEVLSNLNLLWLSLESIEEINGRKVTILEDSNFLSTRMEFGMSGISEISGLQESINFLQNYQIKKQYPQIDYTINPLHQFSTNNQKIGLNQEALYYIESLSELLFENLKKIEEVGLIKVINSSPSYTISFFPTEISSKELAEMLHERKIICQSGYLNSHNYLKLVLKIPPLIRLSIGLHNTPRDLVKILKTLEEIL